MTTFRDASPEDVAAVGALLGREPSGRFAVVVRRSSGEPVVIENEPHLRDGTPMPTLFWLVDPELNTLVSQLEGDGGVHRFEEELSATDIAAAHRQYESKRQAATLKKDGPMPSGGVGGTRTGIKCLHAHLAYFLAGGDDPVGRMVAERIPLPELVKVDVRA